MKAIYLKKYGNSASAFEIKEMPIPIAAKGEVVIKVACFGLNFADVVARRGLYPDAPANPVVLGYDVAGVVESVGEDGAIFKIGQRVMAFTRFGGYAEYVKTVESGVALMPDTLDFAAATALVTQGSTAYFCAYQSTVLNAGDRVLIHAAAGGVGSLLVQMAKQQKCIVYGTASTSKLNYLKQSGVDVAIDYTQEDFSKVIRAHSNDQKIDVVFDSIGGRTFKNSFKLLAPGGRIVTFGAAEQIGGNKTNKLSALKLAWGFGIFSPIQLLLSSKAIIGVNMLKIADNRPHILSLCLREVLKMTEAGTIVPTVGKIFSADKIAEAHDYLENRQSVGKVVMAW